MRPLAWSRAVPLAALVSASMLVSCGSGSEKRTDLLVIPNAVFLPNGPSATVKSMQTPTLTGPSQASVIGGAKAVWRVEFKSVTEIAVSFIVVEVESIEGSYIVPLTPAEVEAGWVDVPIFVSQTVGPEICQRNYRGVGTCYAPVSEGTTDVAFSAAGDDGKGGLVTSFSRTASIAVEKAPETPGQRVCSGQQQVPCGCVMEACCDGTSCGYLVNGDQWYQCAAKTDCGSAAQAVVSWCTGMCQ